MAWRRLETSNNLALEVETKSYLSRAISGMLKICKFLIVSLNPAVCIGLPKLKCDLDLHNLKNNGKQLNSQTVLRARVCCETFLFKGSSGESRLKSTMDGELAMSGMWKSMVRGFNKCLQIFKDCNVKEGLELTCVASRDSYACYSPNARAPPKFTGWNSNPNVMD